MEDYKATLLIADDEENFLLPLRDNLELEGFRVETATNGQDALQKALLLRPDLLLLDIMMPKMDGFEVCRNLERNDLCIPIIILSARDEEVDVVLGLKLGADDYITKPFRLRELCARIEAVLRRQKRMRALGGQENETIVIGVAELNFNKYEAKRKGRRVKLTPREFAVLHYLWERKGTVLTRDELLCEVWGYDRYPTTRTVDNHIARIRKVIEDDPAKPKHLQSVHAVGYRLSV